MQDIVGVCVNSVPAKNVTIKTGAKQGEETMVASCTIVMGEASVDIEWWGEQARQECGASQLSVAVASVRLWFAPNPSWETLFLPVASSPALVRADSQFAPPPSSWLSRAVRVWFASRRWRRCRCATRSASCCWPTAAS